MFMENHLRLSIRKPNYFDSIDFALDFDKIFSSLSNKHKEVIILVFYGYDYDTISEILGVSNRCIQSRIRSIKAKISYLME